MALTASGSGTAALMATAISDDERDVDEAEIQPDAPLDVVRHVGALLLFRAERVEQLGEAERGERHAFGLLALARLLSREPAEREEAAGAVQRDVSAVRLPPSSGRFRIRVELEAEIALARLRPVAEHP